MVHNAQGKKKKNRSPCSFPAVALQVTTETLKPRFLQIDLKLRVYVPCSLAQCMPKTPVKGNHYVVVPSTVRTIKLAVPIIPYEPFPNFGLKIQT